VITSKVFLDKVSTGLTAFFRDEGFLNEVSTLFCEDFAKHKASRVA
jgi:chemotaxis methyl-accepting protein methylase